MSSAGSAGPDGAAHARGRSETAPRRAPRRAPSHGVRARSARSTRRTTPTAPGPSRGRPGSAARASPRRSRDRRAARRRGRPGRARAPRGRSAAPRTRRTPRRRRPGRSPPARPPRRRRSPSAIAHSPSSERSCTASSVAPSRCITGSARPGVLHGAPAVAQLHGQLRELRVQHRGRPWAALVVGPLERTLGRLDGAGQVAAVLADVAQPLAGRPRDGRDRAPAPTPRAGPPSRWRGPRRRRAGPGPRPRCASPRRRDRAASAAPGSARCARRRSPSCC